MVVGSAGDGECPYGHHHDHHYILVDGFWCCSGGSSCRRASARRWATVDHSVAHNLCKVGILSVCRPCTVAWTSFSPSSVRGCERPYSGSCIDPIEVSSEAWTGCPLRQYGSGVDDDLDTADRAVTRTPVGTVDHTDHAALTYLMKTLELTGQQSRWLDLLSEYDIQFSTTLVGSMGTAMRCHDGRVNAMLKRTVDSVGDKYPTLPQCRLQLQSQSYRTRHTRHH